MAMTPEAIFHVTAGSLAMLAGATVLIARKGTRLHRVAGTVFFGAILMTAAAALVLSSHINNTIAAILVIYLVMTGWMAIRRRDGETGYFELGAFLFAAAAAIAAFYFAIDAVQKGTAMLGGVPSFIFAAIVALAAALDLSVILRGGLSGKQRIARHLWRMHLGFAAAVGSFFPGQLHRIMPELLHVKPFFVLFTPPLLVVALMIFWLVRVLLTNWYGRNAVVPLGE